MARIAGIKIEKDARGKARYIRFDLKKWGDDLQPLLNQIGFNNGIDEKNYITGGELRSELFKRIDAWEKL